MRRSVTMPDEMRNGSFSARRISRSTRRSRRSMRDAGAGRGMRDAGCGTRDRFNMARGAGARAGSARDSILISSERSEERERARPARATPYKTSASASEQAQARVLSARFREQIVPARVAVVDYEVLHSEARIQRT